MIAALSLSSGCGDGDGDGNGSGSGSENANAAHSADESFWVMYTPDPDPIPGAENFSLTVMVHDGADKETMLASSSIEVDALMPAMNHGMATTPTVTAMGTGMFTVQNMNFPMGGAWEIYVDVTNEGTEERAKFDVVLE